MSGHHYDEKECGEEMEQKEKQVVHCEERWNWRHNSGDMCERGLWSTVEHITAQGGPQGGV